MVLTKILSANAEELHDDAEREFVLARSMSAEARKLGIGGLYVRLFSPERVLAPEEVVSVNGIGDTFCGAVAVGIAKGRRVQDIVGFAQKAAGLSLRCRESVSPELEGLRI